MAKARKSRKLTSSTRRQRDPDIFEQHQHWLRLAQNMAQSQVSKGGSPHPRVKVGAALVDQKGKLIAAAANRFALGVDRRRSERYQDGFKSLWINCAEQMVLMDALKKRASLQASTLYVTLEPCAVCAGLIAEVKIKKVCVPVGAMRRYAKLKAKWKESIEVGLIKLAEAGVEVIAVDRPFSG